MNFVEFQDLLALPFVVSKKGSKFQRPSGPALRGYPRREIILFAVHDIITFLFSSVSSSIKS